MKTANIYREEKINALICAALDRYSHEELFKEFLETITSYTDRRSVAQIAITDENLIDDILFELESAKVSLAQLESMKTALELNGYTVIECKSLAQQIRVEQFINELETNPYQLKLVS